MKKGVKKEEKIISIVLFSILIILLVVSTVSAGFWDKIKKTITGKATTSGPVSFNISVGGPEIQEVYNNTMTDVSTALNEGPISTSIIINFSAYLGSGIENLNASTASINFSKTNEVTRQNTSCIVRDWSGNEANFTCNVTMWWYDAQGTWDITAFVKDNQTNLATNTSTDFQVGSTTSFEISPGNLTWTAISPGGTNLTSSNDPFLLNNTGNVAIGVSNTGNISINATNLRGEDTNTLALWAGNFSVHWNKGGTPPAECDGTTMSAGNYINISNTNLTKGNYTVNDGDTGQEELYFCIKLAGTDLISQSYSTINESTWTILIE